jgi:predicted GH43/DUF377 family glycosyl hydrolase
MTIKLQRVSQEPILKPRKDIHWEQDAVLNTAAIFEDGTYHLFYRAVEHPGWINHDNWTCPDYQYHSCVGHATSSDGIHFVCKDEPVIQWLNRNGDGTLDFQDPRVTKINDTYYMVYCIWENKTTYRAYPGYAVSKDLIHWEHKGPLISFNDYGYNKNAMLFPEKINGRFTAFHRPESMTHRHLPEETFDWSTWSRSSDNGSGPDTGVAIAFSKDLSTWTDSQVIMTPRKGFWDNTKIGPGAPPIKTPVGWLNIYHGVDENHVYRLGISLLDLKDPTKVLKRQEDPILEPEMDWEKVGDVPNVVFTCGAILQGTELTVYYGGADTVIGAAKSEIKDFLIT